MEFQILVSLFKYILLFESDGYLLRKETNSRVQSRSCGRSSSPAEERLGVILLSDPKFIERLFQRGISGIGTVPADRQQFPKMIDDKQMKRKDYEFLFLDNTVACKWMDNR